MVPCGPYMEIHPFHVIHLKDKKKGKKREISGKFSKYTCFWDD
jgi:hypothetical protein